MRKVTIASVVVSCLLGPIASAWGDASVLHVGVNPWFPNTGGTGAVAGQQPGTATIEKTFTAIGDVPIILHSTPSAGVDVLHIDERVRNNTGVTWTDFHFVMEPIDANPSLHVAFLNVANPTGEWTSILPGANFMTLLGSVPDGGIFSISFDLQIVSEPGSFDLFGIHEVPTIPEPSTLALLGCSLLSAAWVRRRPLST